jgi:DNA-binding LacI/PurR family transcriptional regulator
MSQASLPSLAPKYLKIAEAITRLISRGKYKAGDQLDSIRDLAKEYNVTPVTIGKALSVLEKNKVIARQHGKGTFVLPSWKDSVVTEQTALMLPMQGHFFSSLFSCLINELHNGGYHATPFDYSTEWDDQNAIKHLKTISSGSFNSLLIDGSASLPFPELKKRIKDITNLTFIFRCETALDFESTNRILADFYKAGEITAQHLLSTGCKSIMAMVFRDHNNPQRTSDLGAPYSCQQLWHQGICNIADAAGIEVITHFCNDKTSQAELEAHLERTNLGVACMGDHRAVSVYQTCAAKGITIGEDISIIGLYNTPWSTELFPNLTSVSLSEDEIAKQAVKLFSTTGTPKTIHVAPELIIRNSTQS